MTLITRKSLTALTLALMTFAANAHAGDGRSWDGHAQDDSAHYRTTADVTPLNTNASSRVWDGKQQDDAAHYLHKGIATRMGGDLYAKAGSSWPMGRTWDGRQQADVAHYAAGSAAPAASSATCADMPCCKSKRMTPKTCRMHMMRK